MNDWMTEWKNNAVQALGLHSKPNIQKSDKGANIVSTFEYFLYNIYMYTPF